MLTKLIINNAHKITLHGHVQLLLNHLRQQYWILNARSIIKSQIKQCMQCCKNNPSMQQYIMADLPKSRVTPSKPFSHCSIDYAGPFELKAITGRGRKINYKGYICLFTCHAVKAVHLEAVTDMTSDAFLAAFRRFLSRRGYVTNVYSDCGTNFVGANNLIKQYINISKKIVPILTTENITWHFSPPGSPHFNGLVERVVRSTKYHLRRIVGSTVLTYEEFSTLLSQIEACLNSRPLCTLSDDPTNLFVLTPGHFLIGCAPLTTQTECNMVESNMPLRSRWKLLQTNVEQFWKKWSIEYLNELQQRYKWNKNNANIQIGQIVLIKNENLSSFKWPLGKIIELHPGADGIVRVVTIKSQQNTIKRPVNKLCILPTDIHQSSTTSQVQHDQQQF